MRTIGIASLLACLTSLGLGLPLVAHADETLNLQLPSTKEQMAPSGDSGSKEAREFEAASRRLQSKQAGRASSRGQVLASRGGQGFDSSTIDRHTSMPRKGNERIVGRLGLASHNATIRVGRSSGKRALTKVAAGSYFALTDDKGDWYGVLMSDQSTGWIPKKDVQVLDFQVYTDEQKRPSYAGSIPNTGNQLLTEGQRAILQTAYNYMGVPYKWGGTTANGLDCSALVQKCFASQGISLPRTAHEQITCGMPVSVDQLQAADRLYFASRDGRITHTGMYIGNGYFIHASSSRHGVAVSNLSEPLYRKMYAGARR